MYCSLEFVREASPLLCWTAFPEHKTCVYLRSIVYSRPGKKMLDYHFSSLFAASAILLQAYPSVTFHRLLSLTCVSCLLEACLRRHSSSKPTPMALRLILGLNHY